MLAHSVDVHHQQHQAPAEEKTPEVSPVKRPGGAQRAFVSEFISGHRGDYADKRSLFLACHDAYRRLKAAGGPEWDRLVRRGEVGNRVSLAGGNSFGYRRSGREQLQPSLKLGPCSKLVRSPWGFQHGLCIRG